MTLRLDPDMLDRFHKSGPGWQEQINDALRKALGIGEFGRPEEPQPYKPISTHVRQQSAESVLTYFTSASEAAFIS